MSPETPPAYFGDLPQRFARLCAALPPALASTLVRYGCAPFASDPAATLRPGPLYVCSLKPYAAPGVTYPNGWIERETRPGLHRWYDGPSARGNFVREADLLLRHVLAAVGLADTHPRSVFNTYAFPWRCEDARQLKQLGLAELSVEDRHRQWLSIVRPRVILCIGNGPAPSAFVTMCSAVGLSPSHVTTVSPAPRVKVRYAHATVGFGESPPAEVLIVGVPHLSRTRFSQIGPGLPDFTR